MNDHPSSPDQSLTPSPAGTSGVPATPELLALREEPTPPKRPKLVLTLGIVAMIALIAALGGWKALQIKGAIAKGKAFRMPPDAVTSIVVSEETISPVLEAVGWAPKGTAAVHRMLISAALDLEESGRLGCFTPMYLCGA